MHPFKRIYYLKQHTPIIHFQWGQESALLRATELKPKLDAYLFQKLGEQIKDDWLVGKGKLESEALNYKMRFYTEGEVETDIIEKGKGVPMFFGNMGNEYRDDKRKALQTTKELVQVELTCMVPELLAILESNFEAFISQTNVGTRQNKGYGSFSVVNGNKTPKDFKDIFGESLPPYLEINSKKQNEIFLAINYYYQRLKSGINFSKDYHHHSFLKTHIQGMTWEKPWIKALFIAGDQPKKDNHKFARALMGMPGSFTYKPPKGGGNRGPYPRKETEISILDQRLDNNQKDPQAIARIKSPLTFKPVIYSKKTRIYIFTRPYSAAEIELLKDKPFIFEGGGKKEMLKLPSAEEIRSLNLDKMIEAYHCHLGEKFTARDYTGKQTIDVNIFPIPECGEHSDDYKDDSDISSHISSASDLRKQSGLE